MKKSINDIIEQFPNGEERFMVDPLFNKVIMMLYHNQDPLIIIDSLIKSNNEISEAFRNYILNN